MREAESKIIDGHEYRCTMMSVRSAHRTFLDLCSTLGGPVINAIAEGSDDMEGDATRLITGAISLAVQNLDGPVGDQLIESVFSGVAYTGKSEDKDDPQADGMGFELKAWDDDFERHFGGRLLSMYKVWAWSVEVNYRDFLDGAQALGGDRGAGIGKKVFQSLRTQTSASGT
tara:strand:- start:2280 stop:2795 length:516 start_codon:yes stop_codon:yes gene_type:complete